MKQTNSYRILQFNFAEVYSNSDISSENELKLSREDLRVILMSKIPYYLRSTLSCEPSLGELAENAAVNIPNNALLRIMRNHMDKELQKVESAKKEQDIFLYDLIYVDIGNAEEKQIKKLIKGLTIQFDDQAIRFVPFERSASQTRTNQLVMISEMTKKKEWMEEAIQCGTGIAKDIDVIPAKWAAYRALLLTSGLPVNGLDLNENTVIVVPDFKYQDLIDAQKAVSGSSDVAVPLVKIATVNKQEQKYTVTETDISQDILFDGEGLISPAWAEKIVEQIIDPKENVKAEEISSFQVRMPFTKGLLHSVDFHGLFQEVFGNQPLFIQDCFGVQRDLSKAQIILSQSMFKASVIKDEAAYKEYWAAFDQNGHCLYISNCDASMTDNEKLQTITNYQFLSTMNFGDRQEYAVDVIRPAMAAVLTAANSPDASVISYLMRSKKEISEDVLDTSEIAASDPTVQQQTVDDTGKDGGTSQTQNKDEVTDAMLLQKCPELATNTAFSNIMSKLSMLDSCAVGRLYTSGSLLYLSGDLVQMLFILACKRTVSDENGRTVYPIKKDKDGKFINPPEPLKMLCKETKRPDDAENAAYYYAPGVPAQACILDRNPHLSRQEHVFAKPLPTEETSFRKKYFGHLKGVCMVRLDCSYAAGRLGGADYDGDLVRLFYDQSYIEAAKGSMNLPALSIPSAKGTKVKFTDDEREKLLLASSQNRVGLFSNAGFYSALFAYHYRKYSSEPGTDIIVDKKTEKTVKAADAEEDIVKLSVLTGEEIDAAKTGVRPEYQSADNAFMQQQKQAKAKFKEANTEKESDPYYHTDWFIRFKEMMKGSQKKAVEMAVLNPQLGCYSPIEALPYIFRPSLVTLKDKAEQVFPLEWVTTCHNVLWDESKGKYSLHVSDEIKVTYAKKSLQDLITDGEGQTLQTDFVQEAIAAVQAFRSLTIQFGPQISEPSSYLSAIRKSLCRAYGLSQAKQYTRMLEEFSGQFHDTEMLLSELFEIIPYRNLENSWLRYQRFIMKLQKDFSYHHEYVKDFEKLFDLNNTDSVETAVGTDAERTGSINLLPCILRSVSDDEEAFLNDCKTVIETLYSAPSKRNEIQKTAWEFCQKVLVPLRDAKPDVPEKLAQWIETNDSDKNQKNWVKMTREDRRKFLEKTLFQPKENQQADEQEHLKTLKMLLETNWRLLPYFLRYCIVTAEKNRKVYCRKNLRLCVLDFFGTILKTDLLQTGSRITKEDFENTADCILHQCGKPQMTEFPADISKFIYDFDKINFDKEQYVFVIKKRSKNGEYFETGRIPLRTLLWFGLLFFVKTEGLSAAEKVRMLFQTVSGIEEKTVFLRSLLKHTDTKEQCQAFGFETELKRDEFVFQYYKAELYHLLKTTPTVYKPVRTDTIPDIGYLDGCQGFCLKSSLRKKQKDGEVTIQTIVSEKLPESPEALLEEVKKAVTVTDELTVLPKMLNEDEAKLLYERLRVQRLVALPFIIEKDTQEIMHGYVTFLWLPACLKGKIKPVKQKDPKEVRSPLPYFIYGYQVFERKNSSEVTENV